MDFDLSEDQELFKATAERFVAPIDVDARQKIRRMDGGYDRARWKELGDLGFLALAADNQQGGMGGSIRDFAVIAQAFGNGNALDPWLENGLLPIRILAKANPDEQLESYLSGDKMACLGFAETANRYSLQPTQTKAKPASGGFEISGEKSFVMGGALADSVIVSADLKGELALFLLPLDHEAVDRRSYRIADGSNAAEVFLRRAQIPQQARLNITGEEFKDIIAEISLIAAAEICGLAQRLLDDTVSYVQQREQFGVPIGSFQAIQHGLADCYVAIEQMQSSLLRTVLECESGVSGQHAKIVGTKLFVGEKADKTAKSAVQYHGGMGITDELAIGHALKRLLLLIRLFGDPVSNLSLYSESICKAA